MLIPNFFKWAQNNVQKKMDKQKALPKSAKHRKNKFHTVFAYNFLPNIFMGPFQRIWNHKIRRYLILLVDFC
jgi:hypothetical protein